MIRSGVIRPHLSLLNCYRCRCHFSNLSLPFLATLSVVRWLRELIDFGLSALSTRVGRSSLSWTHWPEPSNWLTFSLLLRHLLSRSMNPSFLSAGHLVLPYRLAGPLPSTSSRTHIRASHSAFTAHSTDRFPHSSCTEGVKALDVIFRAYLSYLSSPVLCLARPRV